MGLDPYFSPEHLSLFRCDCCKQIDRDKFQQYTFPEHYLVKIDPQAFKQVLSNLLSNALQITTEGAVKITTSLGHIDDNHAVIKMTIMDSRSGLSQEEQQLNCLNATAKQVQVVSPSRFWFRLFVRSKN